MKLISSLSQAIRCAGAVVAVGFAIGPLAAPPVGATGPLDNLNLPGETLVVADRPAFILLPPEEQRQ